MQNAFYNGVVSQFREKVGCKGVLNGEHTAHVMVVGLDKATISMHCYLTMSRSPDVPQMRWFYTLYVIKKTDTMPTIISVMKNVISKTCWLS